MSSVHVRVGDVVRPHGIRGELVVDPVGDSLNNCGSDASVYVAGEPEARRLRSVRPHKGRLLVQLDGVRDRDAAEALRGAAICLPEDQLSDLADGELRVDDLLGAEVWRADGVRMGVVVNVVESTAHDLLEIDTGQDVVMVPMVRDWLVELSEGRIVLDTPPGLLEAENV